MLLANQKYLDPSPVLNTVVDDFGKKIGVGSQLDISEYLLNFIERLEEGLDERKEQPSEGQDVTTDTGLFSEIEFETAQPRENASLEESYIVHTRPQIAEPLAPKSINAYSNTICENFFG